MWLQIWRRKKKNKKKTKKQKLGNCHYFFKMIKLSASLSGHGCSLFVVVCFSIGRLGPFTWEKSPNCHCSPTVFPSNPSSKVPMVVFGQLTDECSNCLSEIGSLLKSSHHSVTSDSGRGPWTFKLLSHCMQTTALNVKTRSLVCIFT